MTSEIRHALLDMRVECLTLRNTIHRFLREQSVPSNDLIAGMKLTERLNRVIAYCDATAELDEVDLQYISDITTYADVMITSATKLLEGWQI